METYASPSRSILFVSNSGGVLLDLLALRPWWQAHRVCWAVVRAADTESALADQYVVWIRERPGSRPWTLIGGVIEAWRVLHQARPDILISAGSGAAIGFFLVARWMRIPTFWIETFNMMDKPCVSSRICGRLASEVLLQRPEMLKAHPRGIVIGELY